MKILVMGAGGIGGYYGARLAQAGVEVFFVARGAHLKAIQNNGLQIQSVAGDFKMNSVAASDDPKEAGKVDVVLHCTKSWDIESSTQSFVPTLRENSIVVHFQNGANIAEQIAKFVPKQQIIGGVAYGVVQILEPGVIEHSTEVHKLIYGSYENSPSDPLVQFDHYCQKAKFEGELVNNIQEQLWSKFLFVCAYSGITSLVRLPIGPIINTDETKALFRECMSEIKIVAEKKGIDLPSNIVEDRLKFAEALEPQATSSMQRDLMSGKQFELEALNGALSRLGKELRIPTPVNNFIYAALKPHL